jgi:hypothetical protein
MIGLTDERINRSVDKSMTGSVDGWIERWKDRSEDAPPLIRIRLHELVCCQ